MNDDEMTREEAEQAGLIEGPNYRDFAPPDEDDPEAYAEMCREERICRELGRYTEDDGEWLWQRKCGGPVE